jgi:nitroreductase
MLDDLISRNRSYRRFDQNVEITLDTLKELVDLARLSASASNLQALKFFLSCDDARNALIFPTLAWAGYIADWPGPAAGERPTGYIVILGDTTIAQQFHCDHGIAAQSILLGATERGLGGCIIAAVDRTKLQQALVLPDRYEILLVIALGKPNEKIVIDTVALDGDIKYWRDERGVHHVPKRSLDDIIVA